MIQIFYKVRNNFCKYETPMTNLKNLDTQANDYFV